ncbi:winged helix DNA-binding domain-containing protein [Sporocytophaga myxococcoides]|uniref:winged helix DNA-binding domain-containing protein n=1 Tax=Sporocytophaga myxococcoides TaxID=153721 RepID=UPI000685227A|nr:winged helix DNA-binding domain-containing protein [Sporocytophaga myxococcoides]
MTPSEILNYRLINHGLVNSSNTSCEEVVRKSCVIQSQDFPASKLAIGIRLPNSSESDIINCINDGSIIRTSALRGTLHLVSSKDIKWILDLAGPAVITRMHKQYHSVSLDEKSFSKAFNIFSKELDGIYLTRQELYALLIKNGLSPEENRGVYLINRASLQKIICQGPMKDNEITFTLLDSWAPEAKILERKEALYELAKKYFQSHGPATFADFVNWSGLSNADAKNAFESILSSMTKEIFNQSEYWYFSNLKINPIPNKVLLLPAFDEYILGYKNRELFLDAEHNRKVITVNGLFYPTVIVNGRVVGVWKKILSKGNVILDIQLFDNLSKIKQSAIKEELKSLESFLEMPVIQKAF